MRAAQGECGLFVIEMIDKPAFRPMAAGAILVGVIFFIDPALVYVVVAFDTSGAELHKLPFTIVVQMAGETGGSHVRAGERETCFFVLFKTEGAALKTVHGMAMAAIRAATVLDKLPFVKIGMAGCAILVCQGFRHAAAGMALAAIYALVHAFEGEFGSVVVKIFPGAFAAKARFVVAFGAVGPKLSAVHIVVTSSTGRGGQAQAVLKNPAGTKRQVVALSAIDLLVPAFEGEMGTAVIKVFVAGKYRPTLFGVATFAVAAQILVVWVAVAVGTVGKGYAGKTLERFTGAGFLLVTIKTSHLGMFAEQGKVCFTVIKVCRRRKSRRVMAAGAIGGKRVLMDVRVAGSALLAEAQKGFFIVFVIGVLDMVGFMAIAAIGFPVRAAEFVACPIVVKTFFINPDHLKIPPVVFAVTVEAVFAAHLAGSVIPFPLLYPGIDGFVAFQALGTGDAFAQYMTFGTVEHSFQIGMRRRQFARGNLGKTSGMRQNQHNKNPRRVQVSHAKTGSGVAIAGNAVFIVIFPGCRGEGYGRIQKDSGWAGSVCAR